MKKHLEDVAPKNKNKLMKVICFSKDGCQTLGDSMFKHDIIRPAEMLLSIKYSQTSSIKSIIPYFPVLL